MALGIARAGFEHELVLEYDQDSANTLRENKARRIQHVRHWEIAEADVREVDYGRHEGADLVSGGPPCQPFSIGGKHLGPRDPRNMWPEAIRAVRTIRPKAFIFENVRGLFRPDFSEYRDYITLQLTYPEIAPKEDEFWLDHLRRLKQHSKSREGAAVSYRVLSQSINAADYGAPQKRHRAIFIGIAGAFGEEWSFPAPTHSQEALAWAKHIDGSYWQTHDMRRGFKPSSATETRLAARLAKTKEKPSTKPWVTVRDSIVDLPAPLKSPSASGHWQHPGARVYPNHTGSCLDEPAKALKAGDHGVPGGENMLVSPRGNVRYFTVREMARLQSLPDDYYISGSWKAATRQLGNAVPTVVAELIGKAVKKIIDPLPVT
ncbi:DNA cytosine methyltransferase [Novosphingobium naphthalenivorans]|uniref:DNA cytosine methyltransferase n=1 Tax=Novosphingobium naphthalenivorans TaxID=273168 RepID=UPI001FDF0CF0|nr:DNA cytosine methyltransferase [Novosphingobium naphthalenivorans]